MMANRTLEQLRMHYEIERELADRLRNAPKDTRRPLYATVYDELFQRVHLHPQLTRTVDPVEQNRIVTEKLQLLKRYLKPESVFLEVGAGDCRLGLQIAPNVKKAYGLEVSREVTRGVNGPSNFEIVYSDGTDIPLSSNSVTVAYSYQVMEHIHPEDSRDQLKEILRVLAPGGVYICITPNRLSGPHDVSRFFEDVAKGFHLKEYTLGEVAQVMRGAGFEKVGFCPGVRGRFTTAPIAPLEAFERMLETLPHKLARAIASAPLLRNLFLAGVCAHKPFPAQPSK